tara:strand:+ start:6126 stop:6632 length:507 start_codon:yes stop_codon:yes gene_type:complete
MQKQEKTIIIFPRTTLTTECTFLKIKATVISKLKNNGRPFSEKDVAKKSPKIITRRATKKPIPISIKYFLGLPTVLVTSHDIVAAKKATKTVKYAPPKIMETITGTAITRDEVKRTNVCFVNKGPKFNLIFSKVIDFSLKASGRSKTPFPTTIFLDCFRQMFARKVGP